MENKTIKLIETEIFKETLDNGLEVIIIPNKKTSKTIINLLVNFGGIDLTYEVDNKHYDVNPATAHFLEHKIFEYEQNGKTVFELSEQYQASANAYTNFYKTVYHFSYNSLKHKELINLLLNMTQNFNITEESVNKEKGIIKSELQIYLNQEDYKKHINFKKSCYGDLSKHDILGSREEIDKISKESLLEVHNVFYQPSNTKLIVVGAVDPKEIINIVKENQKQKNIKKINFNRHLYIDKRNSFNKENIFKHKIEQKEVLYIFKNMWPYSYEEFDYVKMKILLSILSNAKGNIKEVIKNENISVFEPQIFMTTLFNCNLLEISLKINETDKFISIIDKFIKEKNNLLTKEKFILYKQSLINHLIANSDSNSFFADLYIESNNLIETEEAFEKLKNLTYEEFIQFVDSLNFNDKLIIEYVKENN